MAEFHITQRELPKQFALGPEVCGKGENTSKHLMKWELLLKPWRLGQVKANSVGARGREGIHEISYEIS
jgi:hypothetical protein